MSIKEFNEVVMNTIRENGFLRPTIFSDNIFFICKEDVDISVVIDETDIVVPIPKEYRDAFNIYDARLTFISFRYSGDLISVEKSIIVSNGDTGGVEILPFNYIDISEIEEEKDLFYEFLNYSLFIEEGVESVYDKILEANNVKYTNEGWKLYE